MTCVGVSVLLQICCFPLRRAPLTPVKNMISILNIKSSIYDSYLDKFLQILILMNVWECHRRWTGIGLEIGVGPLLTKKTSPYGYRNSHYKPKTVWRPSQVYNGNAYTNNTMSSSSIEAQCREARGRCPKQSYHISMTISNFTQTLWVTSLHPFDTMMRWWTAILM